MSDRENPFNIIAFPKKMDEIEENTKDRTFDECETDSADTDSELMDEEIYKESFFEKVIDFFLYSKTWTVIEIIFYLLFSFLVGIMIGCITVISVAVLGGDVCLYDIYRGPFFIPVFWGTVFFMAVILIKNGCEMTGLGFDNEEAIPPGRKLWGMTALYGLAVQFILLASLIGSKIAYEKSYYFQYLIYGNAELARSVSTVILGLVFATQIIIFAYEIWNLWFEECCLSMGFYFSLANIVIAIMLADSLNTSALSMFFYEMPFKAIFIFLGALYLYVILAEIIARVKTRHGLYDDIDDFYDDVDDDRPEDNQTQD